jgi:hypothetical protein
MRIITGALLLMPGVALASSALDGTWKSNLDSVRVNGRPDVFVLAGGEYTCSSCDPELKVKADGVSHPVTGHAYYDEVLVKVISPTSIEMIRKQSGKELTRTTSTVSADGSTLTVKFTSHNGAKVVTGEFTEKRRAKGPDGSHAISGSWDTDKVNGNDVMRTVHYEMTADGFKMSWNGHSYDAKFDEREYPINGDPGHTTVTLTKMDDNTVQEVDHRQGKVVDQVRIAAAKDGKSIRVTDRDLAHGQTLTYTLDKQP